MTTTDPTVAAAVLEALFDGRSDSEALSADLAEVAIRVARTAPRGLDLDIQRMLWCVALRFNAVSPGLREPCADFLASTRAQALQWLQGGSVADPPDLRLVASALEPADITAVGSQLAAVPVTERATRPQLLARHLEDERIQAALARLAPADFVLVPCGTATMGGGTKADQKPVVTHWLPAYFVSRFPVTVGEWLSFAKASGVDVPDAHQRGAEIPAHGLTWHQANDYATHRGMRLLTEREWEKAARGPAGNVYPWGNTFVAGMANTLETGIGEFTPVDRFADRGSSGYGVADMVGNAWEWTSSRYAGYGSQIMRADPRPLNDTDDRVLRGGAYDFDQFGCNGLNRYRCSPSRGWDTHGARLAF